MGRDIRISGGGVELRGTKTSDLMMLFDCFLNENRKYLYGQDLTFYDTELTKPQLGSVISYLDVSRLRFKNKPLLAKSLKDMIICLDTSDRVNIHVY